MKRDGEKFKPFEGDLSAPKYSKGAKDQEEAIKALNTFTMKACNLTDEKSQKLYDGLSGNTKKNRIAAKKSEAFNPVLNRLSNENPFDEF
jgi:hypothetical protein